MSEQPETPGAAIRAEIRAAVAKVCARFPGSYWRERDRARAARVSEIEARGDAP